LAMVYLYPGKTGKELNELANGTKREISKRLAGLAQEGLIRRGRDEEMRACVVTGRLCLTLVANREQAGSLWLKTLLPSSFTRLTFCAGQCF
jgi:hypothetical protein